jgi:hypothetical protein
MTYDELYEHITHYIALPNSEITKEDKRRACLILGAVMEFLLDCEIEGTNPYTIDMTGFIHEKIDELLVPG